MNDPITHGGVDRRYKRCRCSKCKTVRECTPDFDFYTRDSPEGLLECETCYCAEIPIVARFEVA